MKNLPHFRRRSRDIQKEPISMSMQNLQVMHLRKSDQSPINLFARPELIREFLRRKELPVAHAGRVVEIVQKDIERVLVAQRQTNSQIQAICFGQVSNRFQSRYNSRHMPRQHAPIRNPRLHRKSHRN
jgi:hypothetical protein